MYNFSPNRIAMVFRFIMTFVPMYPTTTVAVMDKNIMYNRSVNPIDCLTFSVTSAAF